MAPTADLFETLVSERNAFATTIEILDVGIILTDGLGQIAQVNRAARALLDAATALRNISDRLFARDPKCAIELDQAIEQAERGAPGDAPKRGITVSIIGEDDIELVAWVFPLALYRRRDSTGPIRGGAVIFIRNFGATSPFPAEFLVRRFGMTSAECRLLEQLTQGRTISEAAAALKTSRTTARTHLAHLFRKTGTRRQADLVRLAIRTFAPASL